MILRRTQHTTDTKLAGQLARRTIRNWSNFQTPAGLWLPTNQAVEAATSIPNDWEGPSFNSTKQVSRGPMPLYFGDTSDPDNTTAITARFSDDPRKWIQVQAVGVKPGVPMSTTDVEKKAHWKAAWKNTNLAYQAKPNGFEWFYELKKPGHPDTFEADIRFPPGCSMVPDGDGARFLDDKGEAYAKMPPPWAIDANEKPVGVKMSFGSLSAELSGDGVQTVSFVVDKDDLVSAVYPVTVGPTVNIEGTTDIEDTTLRSAYHSNWGGTDALRHYDWRYIGIIRIATPSVIPAGVITGFRLIWVSYSSGTGQIVAYFIADANDWVEGTGLDQVQAGSCDWFCAKHDTQPWAGSAGCNTSGIDYDTDFSPPTMAFNGIGAYTFTLKPEWPPLWRDGLRLPNGIRTQYSSSSFCSFYSTEKPGLQPYFEIDHIPPGDTAKRFFFLGAN